MALPGVGSQSLFFYVHKWDASKDKLLLQSLIEKIEECRPSPPHLSPHALIYAMRALNSRLNAGVSLTQVEGRVDFLHDRYVCFKYLCNLPETVWDAASNVLHAVDEVWERLFKENKFFQAYYRSGEPEYYEMCTLFGLYDVKKELSHTVIIIEDSTTIKKQSSHKITAEDSSDDEVTPPIMKPKQPVPRKLEFVEDACSTVEASNTSTPFKPQVHVPWSKIRNKFAKRMSFDLPARKPFAMKPKDNQNPDAGYGGSSCASSSPFK